MKFCKRIQMGDSEIYIEGEMDEEGAVVDAIYHKGEEITEMLSYVVNIANPAQGWTKLYNHLCEKAHDDFYETAAKEKIARAEYEWELRTDR